MESVTIDPKSNQANGVILVKCDKPYYYPGDTVVAEVLFRLNKTIDVRKFEMELRGSEVYTKVDPVNILIQREKDEGKEFVMDKKKVRIINSDVLMNKLERVYEPGDYKIIFETDLPAELPSSFFCRASHKGQSWPVQITYQIRADMEGPDGKKLFLYKCPISIRKKTPLYMTIDPPHVKTQEIKNKKWLRIKQGHLSLSMQFQNFEENIEQGKLKAILTIDNSKGCANIKELVLDFKCCVSGEAKHIDHSRVETRLYLQGQASKSKEQRTIEIDMNMPKDEFLEFVQYEKKKKLNMDQKFFYGKRNFGATSGKTVRQFQEIRFMVIYQKKCWTEYEIQFFYFTFELPQAVNPERMKFGMPLDFQNPTYLGKFYPGGTLAQREVQAKLLSENPDQTNTTLI
eukprot:403369098